MDNNSNQNKGPYAPGAAQQPPLPPNYTGYPYPPYSYPYNPYGYYFGYNMTQPFYYPQTSYPPIVFANSTANQPPKAPYVPPTRQPFNRTDRPSLPSSTAATTAPYVANNFPKKEGVCINLKKPQKSLEQPLKIFIDDNRDASPSITEQTPQKKRPIPESLRNYVHRCFKNCKTDFQMNKLELMVKPFLSDVMADGTAFTTDWESAPLLTVKRNKNANSLPSTIIEKKKFNSSVNNKSINIKSVNNKSNNNQSVNNKSAIFDISVDSTKKIERQQRFECKSVALLKDADIPAPQSQIVGLSTALEKPYLRLTTAPDPNTVRPLNILINSFQHVLIKWNKTKNYLYVSEQLKSIRQDLTIQGIRNDFCVRVYEEHARIALEMKDRDEFNQCQTCLKQLYKEGLKGNEPEFIMYNILYLTYTKNHIEMANLLSTLDPSLEKQPTISLAIKLYMAFKQSNFLKFFKVYQKMTDMPYACSLINLFMDNFRIDCLRIMVSSFLPTVSLSYASKMLGFDDINQLQLWMKEHKIDHEGDHLDCKQIRTKL